VNIVVEIDDTGERGFVTYVPNWFERLFGDRPRRGAVHRMRLANPKPNAPMRQHYTWVWSATSRVVEDDVERQIEASVVTPLPKARIP
jgi:hypothetical protein